MNTTIEDVVRVLFGAAGTAFLAMVFKVMTWHREGVEQREGRAIANLDKYRELADLRAQSEGARADDAQNRLDQALATIQDQRAHIGTLEYKLLANGIPLPQREAGQYGTPAYWVKGQATPQHSTDEGTQSGNTGTA